MGIIAERIADLARRCGDLSPIREDVRRVLIEGNRRRTLAGVDFQGKPYAPLAPSTWHGRKGSGPPLAPRGAQSRVVTDYNVQVTAGTGRLTFAASWPGEPWMEFHSTGTRRMPRRDPYGFSDHELWQIRGMMRAYVMEGKVGAPPSVGVGGGAAAASAPRPTLLERGRQRVGRAAAALKSVFPWQRRRTVGV